MSLLLLQLSCLLGVSWYLCIDNKNYDVIDVESESCWFCLVHPFTFTTFVDISCLAIYS